MIAALITVFFLALPNLRYPIFRDQATFCLIAQGLLHGKKLYRDLWDNKPPGIFYLYIPIVKIFGRAMWSIGVVDILWLLAISCCIFSFAKQYLGLAAAFIATVTYAAWHCQADYVNAAQADGFLVLFIFVAWFLLRNPGKSRYLRQACAGVALGAAFWMKYNALAFLPLLLFLPYLDFTGLDAKPPRLKLRIGWRSWLANAAVLMAAFSVVVLSVLACFWLTGVWPYLKQVQFEVLPRYATMVLERKPHYWLWALHATKILLGYWTETATVVALIVAGKRGQLYKVAPVMAAALSGYLCAASQLGFRTYTVETATPFLAMVWGYLGVSLFEGFRLLAQNFTRRGWKVARVMAWVAFATFTASMIPRWARLEADHYEALEVWAKNPEISYGLYWWADGYSHNRSLFGALDYLKKNSHPGDRLFVWTDAPILYFAADLWPPTRFVSNFPLISRWGPLAWRIELIESLQKSPPRFIVVGRQDMASNITYTGLDSEESLARYPALNEFLSKNYELAENFQYIAIYRIRTGSPAAKLPQ